MTETQGNLSLIFSAYEIDGWPSANLEIDGDDDEIYGDWSSTDFIASYNQISFISNDENPQYFTMTSNSRKSEAPPNEWKAKIRYTIEDSNKMGELAAICSDPISEDYGRN